jgi:hypothetical protein
MRTIAKVIAGVISFGLVSFFFGLILVPEGSIENSPYWPTIMWTLGGSIVVMMACIMYVIGWQEFKKYFL